MPVLRVVFVRTLRRSGIKLQRWIVEFLISNLTGVKAHHRVFTNHSEEAASGIQSRTSLGFERKRLEQGSLLFGREFAEFLSRTLFAIRIQPGKSGTEAILRSGSLATMKSMNSATPASFAPSVASWE